MVVLSSSATSIRIPVGVPWPSSVSPWVTMTELSALIAIHESTEFRSGRKSAGVREANGVLPVAAAALPAVAPRTLKAITSAPPPLTNDLRENSFSCMKPVITHLPLP